jgi:pseudouridine-5'-phosphate glycosidase
VADAGAAANVAQTHWALGLRSGLIIAAPLPEVAALDADVAEKAIAQATRDAADAGIHGPATTPFVLARVAALTEGRSVTANLALIENNASIAAQIAAALGAAES